MEIYYWPNIPIFWLKMRWKIPAFDASIFHPILGLKRKWQHKTMPET